MWANAPAFSDAKTAATEDVQKDLIDPAVIGTTGILKAIAKSAPGVKRVVVTSSFAAILSETKLQDPATTFTEASWNPITLEDVTGTTTPTTGYRASKTLAERAAWDFVADPQGSGAAFDLATINPPLVFGPLAPSQWVAGLDAINTSNERLVDLLRGKWKTEIPSTGGTMLWIDVRDVATAHIKAGLEVPEAGGKRLFATQGEFSNREILEIVRKNFPEFADKVPAVDVKGGELSEKRFKFDNSTTTKLLGIDWIPLEKSIVDTVNSLKSKGA